VPARPRHPAGPAPAAHEVPVHDQPARPLRERSSACARGGPVLPAPAPPCSDLCLDLSAMPLISQCCRKQLQRGRIHVLCRSLLASEALCSPLQSAVRMSQRSACTWLLEARACSHCGAGGDTAGEEWLHAAPPLAGASAAASSDAAAACSHARRGAGARRQACHPAILPPLTLGFTVWLCRTGSSVTRC